MNLRKWKEKVDASVWRWKYTTKVGRWYSKWNTEEKFFAVVIGIQLIVVAILLLQVASNSS